MKRIITGILLAASVVYLVLRGPFVLLFAASTVFSAVGVWEFLRLTKQLLPTGKTMSWSLQTAAYVAALASAFLALEPRYVLPAGLLMTAAVLWMTITLWPSMWPKRFFGSSLTALLLSMGYIALPLAVLVWVWRQSEGSSYTLFTLLVVWAGDTAAYFIGKNFGRHKSSPRISPNKTWEGTIASFVGALIVAAVTARYGWLGAGYAELLVLAAALNVAAQLGDLAESALKRGAGVKDSSHLIPGHGGVLDRIDALLFAAPVLWYYWLWRMH